MTKLFIGLGLALAALVLAYMLGPRVPVDTTVHFDPSTVEPDLDAWLARSEAAVPALRPGFGREIVWADGATKAPTKLAIVYIHGFSATKFELRPVPDLVARGLGANLYYARLTGHGQDGAAMAAATVNDWVDDIAEALSIGRLIGERVIVMATSTGGGLATWAAAQPDLAERVAGLVLVSPNYELRAGGAGLLTGPWGRQIANLAAGRERGFEPLNPRHADYWTTRYPTDAILPMAAVTKLAREAPVERIAIPALFVFSDRDAVVSAARTRDVAGRWGAPVEMLTIDDSADPSNHVIAGDALSPETTAEVAEAMLKWIAGLP